LQNPRFEDNGDIGSCDNSSDVTKNKVTAIFSEKVDMSIDHTLLASAEAERLNGENVKSTTTNFLCGLNRSNSVDVSGLARSTNKVGTTNLLGVMGFKSRNY
jgi:hypothetical protein